MKKVLLMIIILGLFSFGCSSKQANDVYLSIRPKNLIENFGDGFVYKELNDDLIIVLKTEKSPIDPNSLPKSISSNGEEIPIVGTTSYVMKKDLINYDMTEKQLFDQALKNFDKKQYSLQMLNDDKGKALIITPKWDDSERYGEDIQQSHLLSNPSLNLLKENLGNEFYVRLSTHEFFVAFRKDIPFKEWENIRNTTLNAFNNEPHPLSDKLYLYSNGKLKEIEDIYPSR